MIRTRRFASLRNTGMRTGVGIPGWVPLFLGLLAPFSLPAEGMGAPPASPAAIGLHASLGRLIHKGGVIVGEDGQTLFVHRPGKYVPASIIKMATALAAFRDLGPEYRFHTDVYRKGNTLYVKGYGDPLLVSEEWRWMADLLRKRGAFKPPLKELVLDGSAFAGVLAVDGSVHSPNPYDAPLGALASNFNTVHLVIGRDGGIESGEPQTPLTPLARRIGSTLPRGRHRINLAAREVGGLAYSGELAQAIFQEAGAKFSRPPRPGRVPAGLAPMLVYRSSRDLREVVGKLMEFSNNFIANHLVMALAMKRHGPPARFSDGMALLRRYLREKVGLSPDQFHLVEGSGLSRHNRISLKGMLAVTDAFHPWAGLLKFHGKEPFRVPAKTGSLRGVYTLAGYLPAPAGSRRPFVIMLNQRRHTRAAVLRKIWNEFAGGKGK